MQLQVLAELVHNAVEHGFEEQAEPVGGGEPPGQPAPRVVVDARRLREGGQETIEVTVTDNGAGLPEGVSGPDRSGLGMQIVEALISDLRGTISWETAKPHGTVVRFTVRLRSNLAG